ncbi:hypothetical protein [Nesterenkonia sp.]|uniref:hypothetical protein n=1 Tax=Nesterenkonia sp. TaxID=704201 RepID=UPI00260FBC83|nr:hypothetical protein [Nesterenkonia sp.]
MSELRQKIYEVFGEHDCTDPLDVARATEKLTDAVMDEVKEYVDDEHLARSLSGVEEKLRGWAYVPGLASVRDEHRERARNRLVNLEIVVSSFAAAMAREIGRSAARDLARETGQDVRGD